MATTDDYPNDIRSTVPVALGAKRNGSIEVAADQDVFVIQLTAGQTVTVEMLRQRPEANGGLSDPLVYLVDSSGKTVAYDDQSGGQGNARLHYSVPTTGTYYIAGFDYATGTGEYWVGAYLRNVLTGTSFNDLMTGTPFPDTMNMGKGRDSFSGGGGDDVLDGGDDIDTVSYSGPDARYTIEHVPVGGWSTTASFGWVLRDTSGIDGQDTLINVERLRFTDIRWALDMDGRAGTTVKLLGAVFGREAIYLKDYVGIGLAQLDAGVSTDSLIALALDAKLGTQRSASTLVTLLYTNLVGSAPTAADLGYYVDLLNTGAYTQISLTGLAAEHALNLANIGFTGLLETGIGYV
jgi:Bacterial pre-peptidase C-terminal domain